MPNRTPLTTSIAMIRSTNSRTFLLLPFSCPSSLDLPTGWAEPFFRRLTAPDAQMLSSHQLVVVAFGCHRFVFALLAPALAGKSPFCYPSASDAHVRGFSCLIEVHCRLRSLPQFGQKFIGSCTESSINSPSSSRAWHMTLIRLLNG